MSVCCPWQVPMRHIRHLFRASQTHWMTADWDCRKEMIPRAWHNLGRDILLQSNWSVNPILVYDGMHNPMPSYSLWPSDTLWAYRSWSTLAQIMAYYMLASQYLKSISKCWLVISGILWHFLEIKRCSILHFKNYHHISQAANKLSIV